MHKSIQFGLVVFVVLLNTLFLLYLGALAFSNFPTTGPGALFLTNTFNVWEQNSFIQHGFLQYLEPNDWMNQVAYPNRSIFYLFQYTYI